MTPQSLAPSQKGNDLAYLKEEFGCVCHSLLRQRKSDTLSDLRLLAVAGPN